jgi:hypothetical protein
MGNDRLIATIGVEYLMIIETPSKDIFNLLAKRAKFFVISNEKICKHSIKKSRGK